MASILGLLAAATVLLGAPTVLSLEVEQERVTAADLARVIPQWRQVPGDIAIAYAPLPGLTRELARAELERLAARYGLVADSPAAWPERLRISRRQRQLERREAEAAVAAAVGRHLRVSPEDVGVEFVHFVSPQVPAGELEFRTHIALPRSSEPLAIPLTWVTRERRSGTLWLRALISIRSSYGVARRPLEARVPLEAGDITFREGALEGPLDRWRLSPAQVLGKSLTRPLAAGERIPRSFLISTPAIERGALVELRLTTGAVELRAPGRAEQAGSVGDRLPFRNLESGRRVMARLLDARRAEVVADGPGIGGRQK